MMLYNLMKRREMARRVEEAQERLAKDGRWSPEISDTDLGQRKACWLQLDDKMADSEKGGWQAEMRRE